MVGKLRAKPGKAKAGGAKGAGSPGGSQGKSNEGGQVKNWLLNILVVLSSDGFGWNFVIFLSVFLGP